MRRIGREVAFAEGGWVAVDSDDIRVLKGWAAEGPRGRMRLCAHTDEADAVQEMLIVHLRRTYVAPHRHVGRSESFHIVEGRADVVVFDDVGNITEVVEMADYTSGLAFYYRICEPAYHCVRVRSDYLVFHESVPGPFDRASPDFAPWAPGRDAVAEQQGFLDELDSRIVAFVAGRPRGARDV